MGIVILTILFITLSMAIAWACSEEITRAPNAILTGVIVGAFAALILSAIIGQSYCTYVGLKEKLAVIEQYGESINLYAEKGVQEFGPDNAVRREITDLKYQNYQSKLGEMIQQMRNVVVLYNKVLVGKRAFNDSFMFSWIIIGPDPDMKTIKMGDYITY